MVTYFHLCGEAHVIDYSGAQAFCGKRWVCLWPMDIEHVTLPLCLVCVAAIIEERDRLIDLVLDMGEEANTKHTFRLCPHCGGYG